MEQLGTITKIKDLRSVWAHEAHDFTKWLSEEENLSLLGEAIGIDIVLEERESPVGDFNADLFAYEEGTQRRIIIENQLEDTNHEHLGKIITYASGKDAEVVVWIVKRARDEHRQAIEWLNQHTDNRIGFFLIEIELWQIGASLKAPMFNIVEKPNDWAKEMKGSESLNETKRITLNFWQQFVDKMHTNADFMKQFSLRTPKPRHYFDISAGSSQYHLSLTYRTQKNIIESGIYISDNKDIFEKFKSNKDQIEEMLGCTLDWREAAKACRIIARQSVDTKNSARWNNYFDWMAEKSLLFMKVIKTFDK